VSRARIAALERDVEQGAPCASQQRRRTVGTRSAQEFAGRAAECLSDVVTFEQQAQPVLVVRVRRHHAAFAIARKSQVEHREVVSDIDGTSTVPGSHVAAMVMQRSPDVGEALGARQVASHGTGATTRRRHGVDGALYQRLDMFEHTYAIGHGSAHAKYIDACFANVNQAVIEKRWQAAHR
jgi:hypothetical protein